MRRSEYLNLASRLFTHVDNGTTDSAEDVKYIPVEHYVDPLRWEREMDTIFKRLPLMLAFTCEMREPGEYKSVELLASPFLSCEGKMVACGHSSGSARIAVPC